MRTFRRCSRKSKNVCKGWKINVHCLLLLERSIRLKLKEIYKVRQKTSINGFKIDLMIERFIILSIVHFEFEEYLHTQSLIFLHLHQHMSPVLRLADLLAVLLQFCLQNRLLLQRRPAQQALDHVVPELMLGDHDETI